jgi:hypothetical protein
MLLASSGSPNAQSAQPSSPSRSRRAAGALIPAAPCRGPASCGAVPCSAPRERRAVFTPMQGLVGALAPTDSAFSHARREVYSKKCCLTWDTICSMPSRDEREYLRPTADKLEAAEKQILEQQRIVEYDTKEFTIELLVQKLGEGGDGDDIYIPSYQRQFTWDPWRQSRFIESVLIGLPIPFLFFSDMKDGRLEVVDGSQRLRTCQAFVNDELALVGCERLDQVDGFCFSDLSKAQQRRLKNRTIRAVVLSPNATEGGPTRPFRPDQHRFSNCQAGRGAPRQSPG